MLSLFCRRTIQVVSGFAKSRNRTSSSCVMENMFLNRDRLIWVDLEMTGLDVDRDQIIEIACLVTDAQLNIVAEGPNLVIHQPESVIESMNDWCKEHHGQSGLTEAVRKSETSLSRAESQVLDFLSVHTPPHVCPLAGNSVHADRTFLAKYMPRLTQHLHYRIVDVSTVKEICKRWFPQQYSETPKKKLCHRALDDIKESIEELRYYKRTIFIR